MSDQGAATATLGGGLVPGVGGVPRAGSSGGAKADIARLLEAVVKYDASDLHLAVGKPPTVRIRGELHNLGTTLLTPDDTVSLMKSITSERHQQQLGEQGGADFGFAFGDVARFRVSVFKQKGVVGVVLRLIPNRLKSFEEIGLPPVIKDVCLRPRGLVLVTGPTGSGKTTTLATMIDFINTERADHIITIEDPIEYYHHHKKCNVTQRELGIDVPSFPEALKRALRQDPDVVLVGEMRDLETISTAITAAETGHLVFATLHTTGAAETINRIVDAFPTNQQAQIRTQLAATLVAVISQTLIPTADGKGRVAAFELMFANDPIKALMRKGETYKINSHIQTAGKEGMILLDDFLFNLWTRQRITYNDMMRRSQEPEMLEQKVREYTEMLKRQKR
ncbi:MAG: type IV pilus twitching motility protein PilT [Planctomycetota bacterium]|nr:type IV pilus twitching motility protein PilT [Planctomycetota bacterium]